MKTIVRANTLKHCLKQPNHHGKTIGFVPTMGYLHDGHLSLIRRCRTENDLCILSIFVNPTQFAPHEDFKRYPRNKKNDELLAKEVKVDIIFYPSIKEMYPTGYTTYIDVGTIGHVLCGKSRPHHFRGVTTIVLKLLNCIHPHKLYLGQKDAQQAIVIKKMLKDLNISTKVSIVPTVREKDGLAMSSRNVYLSKQQRSQASMIYQSLLYAKMKIRNGETNVSMVKSAMRRILNQNSFLKIDYLDCLNADTLMPIKKLQGKILIAIAVVIGKTRLIDNIIIRA